MSKWSEGVISEVCHYTDNLFSLKITANLAPFIAGQFTKLALTHDGQTIQRAFSFVNAPSAHHLEFYVAKVAGGALSPRLAELQAGDVIALQTTPSGFFTLQEIPSCPVLWMLATGTGISPYLSMLQHGADLERFQRIILVHAVRRQADLAYLPLMQQLVQQNSGKVQIVTVLSRETTAYSLFGRIPTLIENGQLEDHVGFSISPANSHVMLCGNPSMIQDTQKVLTERQLSRHLRRKPGHITSEQYW